MAKRKVRRRAAVPKRPQHSRGLRHGEVMVGDTAIVDDLHRMTYTVAFDVYETYLAELRERGELDPPPGPLRGPLESLDGGRA